MIDFALAAERNEGKNSHDSIVEACRLRFRPILMTTMGCGCWEPCRSRWEPALDRSFAVPLGITIIGGLIMSQCCVIQRTPVVYLYFDSLQHLVGWGTRSGTRERSPGARPPLLRRYQDFAFIEHEFRNTATNSGLASK